jgi:Fe-S-cluster containining protein
MPGIGISPCEGCNGRCCYHYFVPVTGYDAWIIASNLHLSMERFLVFLPEPERTAAGFQLDQTGTTHILALNKQPTARKKKPCIFLLTLPGGYARCSIYPHRPLVCQTFPAMLHRGAVTIREDRVCRDGAWNIAAMDLPTWRLRCLRLEMETAVYRLVVQQWNECVATGRPDATNSIFQYFAYLMNVYSRLEKLRRGIPEAEMALIVRTWGQRAGSADDGGTRWEGFLTSAQAVLAEFADALAIPSG